MPNRIRQLLGSAKDQTGLHDFGEDSFLEGLEVLVTAIDGEAQLNAQGMAGSDAVIVGLLANRLQIEDWYARYPEIDEQEIVAPLIGLGLPRTGSTALASLLGEDPHARSLRTWEANWPCPPPDRATLLDDPRLAMASAAMERRAQHYPRMTAMLPTTATSPTECQTFMGYDFKSQFFQPFAHVPSYVEWLYHKADLESTYRYLKRVLKLLQWRWPTERWRIKNPTHSVFMEAIDKVFPDARFVMTHRDPGQVIPSMADLYYELRKASTDAVDMVELGQETTAFCELAMRRMIAFRDRGGDDRFFDIHFAPFQADPFPAVEQLYAWLGEELSPAARAGMEAWRREKPRAGQKYERTDPVLFGLDPSQLRDRFRFYTDRFPVPAA